MRLINTKSLALEEFFDASVPKYAILSHTWEKEEVLFSNIADLDKARAKAGFAKVQGACTLAASQGFDYIWIDTCCIDKSSSAELSEAINSMYRWYNWSQICYAYLCDVEEPSQLSGSRWFTRGWTLQELIAPRRVEFYTASWDCIGAKEDSDLVPLLSQASLVDECVLSWTVDLNSISVAKKMYWASKRTTTRKEDEAYCLMGLFGVNMPLLYGEGPKAYRRLQSEITKVTNDQSILAWYCDWQDERQNYPGLYEPCYAPSPKCFAMSGNIYPMTEPHLGRVLGHINFADTLSEYSAMVGEVKSDGSVEVALHCQIGPIPGTFPTLVLHPNRSIPGFYYRFFEPRVVTQFSLYPSDDILANRSLELSVASSSRLSSLGMRLLSFREPGEGRSRVIAKAGNPESGKRVFEIKRMRVEMVVVDILNRPASPQSTTSRADGPVMPKLDWLSYLAVPCTFWLALLARSDPNIAISLVDVFPLSSWDRSSHRCFWNPRDISRNPKPKPGDSCVAGVARLRLDVFPSGAGPNSESVGTAVVVFGFTIQGSNRLRRSQSYGVLLTPWCSLLADDGTSELGHQLTSQAAVQQLHIYSSLTMGTGVVLHASVVTTGISGTSYRLIKVWATDPAKVRKSDGLRPYTISRKLASWKGKWVGRLPSLRISF